MSELWSMNVALAMSTWNDIVVAYWRQVYHQSEESCQDWRHSSLVGHFRLPLRLAFFTAVFSAKDFSLGIAA